MPELACIAVRTAQHSSVTDDAPADASAKGDHDHVVATHTCSGLPFRHGGAGGVVVHGNGNAKQRFQFFSQRHVAHLGKMRRKRHPSVGRNETGHSDTDTLSTGKPADNFNQGTDDAALFRRRHHMLPHNHAVMVDTNGEALRASDIDPDGCHRIRIRNEP